MVNLTSGWRKPGPFFPKTAFFYDFQERVGGPPPPPVVLRLIWKTFIWSSTSNHKTAYATLKTQVWQPMQCNDSCDYVLSSIKLLTEHHQIKYLWFWNNLQNSVLCLKSHKFIKIMQNLLRFEYTFHWFV